MATIVPRKRKNGSIGLYGSNHHQARRQSCAPGVADLRSKASGRGVVRTARRRTAEARSSRSISADDPTLADVIDRYVAESEKQIGRTKAQVLRKIKTFDLADLRCSEITSADLVSMAQALSVTPQTRQNYLSHLAAVFAVARPMWGYPLDQQAIKDAFTVARRMGTTTKGRLRDRRPTIEELDRLLDHFGTVQARRPSSIPMQGSFRSRSSRRAGKRRSSRIKWADYEGNRVMVRDMKHPGDKAGNDIWCDLPPEASAIIETMPRSDERYSPTLPTQSAPHLPAHAKC